MKKLVLPDGSEWPDPIDSKDSFNWAAKAYHDLIMSNLSLQQIRDKISLIRQAAGRPRIPTRKLKKDFLYKGVWYTWKELKKFGVPGLSRQNIVSRKKSDWSMERILKTPVRKIKQREKNYKGFASKADYEALHECEPGQLKTLGLT